MFGVLIKSTLTLINLILHELVDPEAHLNVILQHDNDHTVECETQIIFLDSEVLQLLLQHLQLPITLGYDLEGAHTCVVLLGHGGEASPTYVLEVAEQRLHHLLHVIWTFIHVLVGEEAAPLKHDLLIHFLVVLELGKLLLHLVQLDLKVVRLLLP